ncbi:MAG: hypothetical protein JW928_06820 [Candidatus Aureabacteria bacterium]|nr:hypothetical protein [Candidatus Auribacterota bacterium]
MNEKITGMRKCENCDFRKECADTTASWVFLFIGLVATLSVRLVNVVLEFSQLWAKIFWYVGILGFTLFFLYKFRQNIRIKKNLEKMDLDEKLSSGTPLDDKEKAFIRGFLCSVRSKKDTANFFFIFITSLLALLIAVFQDFF